MRLCFQCGQEIAADRTIPRDEECPRPRSAQGEASSARDRFNKLFRD